MKFSLDARSKSKIRGVFEKYEFEVGILNDGPHFSGKRGAAGQKGADVTGQYAGGPVRKKTRKSNITIAEVSKANRERLGINYLSQPFHDKTAEVVRFLDVFMKYVFGKSEKKRLENTLQAVVRNPILRGDYGPQGPLATAIKGFDRPMIDTAQLFKAIKAVCKTKGIK